MKAEIGKSTDGRRTVSVKFERASPDAATPIIEAILYARIPDDFTADSFVTAMLLLSITRTDTREKMDLTPEELDQVLEAASTAIGNHTSWE